MLHRLSSLMVRLVLTLLFLSSCTAFSDPNPFPADPWDLMIPESAIPAGWQLRETSDRPIVSFGEEAAALLIFQYAKDPRQLTRGGITIYRHETIQRAERHYETEANVQLNPNHERYNNAVSTIPEGFEFASPTADEWAFGCWEHGGAGLFPVTIRCKYLGRYRGNIVFFNIAMEYIGLETIEPAALQDLVEAIDEGMSPESGP